MHIEGDAPGAGARLLGLDSRAWPSWPGSSTPPSWSARCAPPPLCAAHARQVPAEVPAALQVLAEGKASATRERAGRADAAPRYGQRAVAARLVADRPHAGLARQWFRSPDVLALLPLDRPQPGPRLRPGVVGARGAADELMALPDEAFEQPR
jgi:2-polyprenyl-6-methoxyphenol hydroxylase-like FAD-dependent oxidoreductase